MAPMDLRDVDSLVEATPDSRNRVVDFLRALAILVVAFGHWTAAAVVVRDGTLVPNQILNIASWTHPLTWVIQVMPVFFLVGGYANALSWRSAQPSRRGVCRVVAFAPASPGDAGDPAPDRVAGDRLDWVCRGRA
jgi:hypothetical protein